MERRSNDSPDQMEMFCDIDIFLDLIIDTYSDSKSGLLIQVYRG